jgi:dGTPase
MLSEQVYDVIDTTRERLAAAGVGSADDVRQRTPLVAFSDAMRADSRHLKAFLFRNLYRHPQVVETTDRARRVVSELFALYMERPQDLPEAHARQPQRARAVADYIAGMTDRCAIREHQRLSGTVLFPA